jgi:peptidoglycan/LPS O-acetylase OafA/YrhL
MWRDLRYVPRPFFIFVTIIVSSLIYYWVERPILRLRPLQFGREGNPQPFVRRQEGDGLGA